MSLTPAQRAKNALLLCYCADALAMPVHWFYDASKITEAFGERGVQRMEDPLPKHPYTFMKTPEVDEKLGKRVVGDVILKTNYKLWGPENQHVHVSLKKGENTLNADVARLVTRLIASNGGKHDVDAYLNGYVAWMQQDPQPYKDTYAEGWHRTMITKIAGGTPVAEAADDTEGAESAGGLVSVVPVIFAELLRDKDVARVSALARKHVAATHNRPRLMEVVDAYVATIAALLFRDSDDAVVPALERAGSIDEKCKSFADDVSKPDQEIMNMKNGRIKLFCDVAHSWPAVVFLTRKYARNPRDGILANVNVGGENVHRGFVQAAMMALTNDDGAAAAVAEFAPQLADRAAIEAEIDAVLGLSSA